MTKTEELEKAITDAIPGLVEDGLITVLEVDGAAYQRAEPEAGFSFPSPTADWGTITYSLAVIPNPKRHWWSFWRPRYIAMANLHTEKEQNGAK